MGKIAARVSSFVFFVLLFGGSPSIGEQLFPTDKIYQFDKQELQPIGWSSNEKYWAARSYFLRTDDCYLFDGCMDSPRNCAGYVSHSGEPFNGGFSFYIFCQDALIEKYEIQSIYSCTPWKKAKDRLQKAKVRLFEYGIDLKEEFQFVISEDNEVRFEAPDGNIQKLIYKDCLSRSKMDTRLFLAGERKLLLIPTQLACSTELYSDNFMEEIQEGMGYLLRFGLYGVFTSQTNTKLVVLGYRDERCIFFRNTSIFIFGVFEWKECKYILKQTQKK